MAIQSGKGASHQLLHLHAAVQALGLLVRVLEQRGAFAGALGAQGGGQGGEMPAQIRLDRVGPVTREGQVIALRSIQIGMPQENEARARLLALNVAQRLAEFVGLPGAIRGQDGAVVFKVDAQFKRRQMLVAPPATRGPCIARLFMAR